VLHWSGMLFSNISVSEVHISFTHTVKADIFQLETPGVRNS
jgi:hypothetical protein